MATAVRPSKRHCHRHHTSEDAFDASHARRCLPQEVIGLIESFVVYVFKSNEELKQAVKEYCSCKSDVKDAAMQRYGPISLWCTRNITDMSRLFASEYDFNEDISNWDTSSVENMSCRSTKQRPSTSRSANGTRKA